MTRIDVWLWSVRVYKSRSLATAAVKGGHIRLNGIDRNLIRHGCRGHEKGSPRTR